MTADSHPRFDARIAIHLALTLNMAWLAIILAWPGDTFGSALAWSEMAKIAGESVWAMVFWGVSSVGVAGITSSSQVLRFLSALVLATSHGVLAALFVLGNPLSAGTGFALILGAGPGYYLVWRRAMERPR